MRELIKSLETLQNKIKEVIGTGNDSPICPELDTQWSISDDGKYINFDRYKQGDMWEYTRYEISSLGRKQEELFCGNNNDLFFVMAHDEDGGWDESELLIFDLKNKIPYEPTDDW